MTPQEKAIELVDKFRQFADGTDPETDRFSPRIEKQKAKECALVVVDEIIESRKDDNMFGDTLLSTSSEYYNPHPMYITYWLQVKQEIEKI